MFKTFFQDIRVFYVMNAIDVGTCGAEKWRLSNFGIAAPYSVLVMAEAQRSNNMFVPKRSKEE